MGVKRVPTFVSALLRQCPGACTSRGPALNGSGVAPWRRKSAQSGRIRSASNYGLGDSWRLPAKYIMALSAILTLCRRVACVHVCQAGTNGPRRRAVAAKERLDRPRHSFKPLRLNLSHILRDPICTQTRVCDCEQYSQSHKLTRSVRIGFHLVTLASGVAAALPPHGLPLAAARSALEDVYRRTGDKDAPPRTRTFGVAAAHDDDRSRWRRRAAQCGCVGRVSRKASSILQHPPRTPPPGGASGVKFRQTIVV